MNTYIDSEQIVLITRSPNGYVWTDWTRPERTGGHPIDLFDAPDKNGWLGQLTIQHDGKRGYSYFHVDRQPNRLIVLTDPNNELIAKSSELREVFATKSNELLAQSAQEAFALLHRFVRLKALSGKSYLAPDLAIEAATSKLAQDRNSASAYMQRATAWHAKGDYARAVSDLTAVIKISTDENQVSKAHYRRGIAYQASRSFELAITDFNTVITREREAAAKLKVAEPGHLHQGALYGWALSWKQGGDLDRAIAGFGEAISLDPKANDAYYHRGLARQSRGDLTGAMADFTEAVRIKPDYGLALAALKAVQSQATARPALLPAPTLAATPATGEKRVALIIGNAAYRHAPRLTNPLNDAQDVSAALRELGFETVVATDLDRAGMNAALDRFSRIVPGADVALLYYSGHGMQWSNRNYLLPVDARIVDASDINRFRLLPLDDVLEVMGSASRVRLVLLDACRNNPMEEEFKLRMASQPGANRDVGVSRGLVRAPASRGLIVAYSTQSNTVASDGTGRNSPFTEAFLNNVRAVDLDIKSMLFRVQGDVDRITSSRQVPELSISLVGEYKLRPGSR